MCLLFVFQANLDGFERGVIPFVRQHIPVDSRVVEFYSGIGVIGLNVADIAKTVFCSDSNPYVGDTFDYGVENLPEVS